MTSYDFWLLLHLTFAVLWVGGGAMVQCFALRSLAAGGAERLARL